MSVLCYLILPVGPFLNLYSFSKLTEENWDEGTENSAVILSFSDLTTFWIVWSF